MVKIFIKNEIGFLTGFSDFEQPDYVAVEIEDRENFPFLEYRFDGTKLVHDPENMPIKEDFKSEYEIVKEEYDKIKQENSELKEQLDKTQEDVTNTQVALTEVFELIENLG